MGGKGLDFKSKNMNKTSAKIYFSKGVINIEGNVRILFCIFTLLIIFLLSLILPKSIKAYSEEKYQNYFYFKAINNTLSVIKSSEVEEKHTSEKGSIRLEALSFLGIDVSNPISILTKEVAYLNKDEFTSEIKVASVDNIGENIKTFILNPFKLE